MRLQLKKAWADGTTAFVMEPLDFIARLVAAIPPPRFHLLRFHGVLAAHATLRSLVVPKHDSGEQELEAQLSLFEQAALDTPAVVTASPELEPRERPYKGYPLHAAV